MSLETVSQFLSALILVFGAQVVSRSIFTGGGGFFVVMSPVRCDQHHNENP